jgi:hypothetical protein
MTNTNINYTNLREIAQLKNTAIFPNPQVVAHNKGAGPCMFFISEYFRYPTLIRIHACNEKKKNLTRLLVLFCFVHIVKNT